MKGWNCPRVALGPSSPDRDGSPSRLRPASPSPRSAGGSAPPSGPPRHLGEVPESLLPLRWIYPYVRVGLPPVSRRRPSATAVGAGIRRRTVLGCKRISASLWPMLSKDLARRTQQAGSDVVRQL